MPDYMEDSWIDDDIEEVDRYRDVNLLDQEKEVTNNKVCNCYLIFLGEKIYKVIFSTAF